jgi:hypothetical protein
MSQAIKDKLIEAGYTETQTAQIISIYNDAESKGIPYPFYYALTKYVVGMS